MSECFAYQPCGACGRCLSGGIAELEPAIDRALARAREQGRQEGAREMRERDCAAVCVFCDMRWPVESNAAGWHHRKPSTGFPKAMRELEPCEARAIRALPIPEPKEPSDAS